MRTRHSILALIFCVTFAPTGLAAEKTFKPDENGQIVFVTPTRNIGCVYTPKGGVEMYVPEDGGPELACDRIEPLYVRLILGASGKAYIFKMVGDTACCSDEHVLDYGENWRGGPYSCTSGTEGIRCRRQDGHGFFASRKRLTVD
ncbi:hypothetical protein Rleg4DRAFT_2840 [Rhizobium leguminosarum bv. trifolii WSM2297]|uniref:Integral membrane protein n=1 Tax=Rhizobium leguminosarum bv. trifolii WSM2297 TaxID=754762 RepID=J0CD83_RHILT|nr:DUF6636 domain-containing protein [Rhizobium leguminosarum]EJC81167.1 hypothetical protein Rleg4DRAFT_2840 [Rhizobium leguminosarum bv. trifolii WSM2297]